LTPGSGIRIRDGKNPDPESGIRDEHPDLIFEDLAPVFLISKHLMQIRIRDLVNPGSGIRDGKSRI
jgi:hypothetical protein